MTDFFTETPVTVPVTSFGANGQILDSPGLDIDVILAGKSSPFQINVGGVVLNRELLDFHAISSLNAAQVLSIRYSSMNRVVLPTSILPCVITGTDAIMNLKLKSIGGTPISNVTNVKPDYQLVMFSGNVGEVFFDVVWVHVSSWEGHVATWKNIPVWSWKPVKT